MARGSKEKYTEKQKRQAEHIAEGYENRGLDADEAKARGWATVNKIHGGGEKGGSGNDKPDNLTPMRIGGRKGGSASAMRSSKNRRVKPDGRQFS